MELKKVDHGYKVDEDINGAVEPLYNGNIAETFWKTSSDNIQRKYGYAYDYQNRLLDAYYQKPNTSIPRTDSYSAHYSYDLNGNILSLERNGEQDLASAAIPIDDLLYTYDAGNRLKSVRDYESFSAGYNDAHTSASQDDFEYDPYGNLALDRDKDITGITYNHLNLPIEITFGGGGKIEYFYDATGVKLKKKVTDGTTITTTEYMDGFQYTNTVLDFFPHSEGYIKAVPTGFGGPGGDTTLTFKYVFTYTDHTSTALSTGLGNIRLKYAQDPSNNNEISILEEDHYYPYGLKHKGYSGSHLVFAKGEEPSIILTPVNPFLGDSYKYKFGGKEYSQDLDLNTYDFGARNYDPALGRWMNIDPLAEGMRSHSPYSYAFNNPIYFVDQDGNYVIPAGFANKFPEITKYIQNYMKSDVMKSEVILQAFEKVTNGNLNKSEISKALTNGSGPRLIYTATPGGISAGNGWFDASTRDTTNDIQLNEELLTEIENVLNSGTGENIKLESLFVIFRLLLHETAHYGDWLDGSFQGGEAGRDFEKMVWFRDELGKWILREGDGSMRDKKTNQEIIKFWDDTDRIPDCLGCGGNPDDNKKTDKNGRTIPDKKDQN